MAFSVYHLRITSVLVVSGKVAVSGHMHITPARVIALATARGTSSVKEFKKQHRYAECTLTVTSMTTVDRLEFSASVLKVDPSGGPSALGTGVTVCNNKAQQVRT